MLSGARRWLRRNRNTIAVGAAVVGGTYFVGQYVLTKINESRQRSQLDRVAKENIRRRFEQNQTDCTITVLALLPTLTENILEKLPVEQLTTELQQKRAERLARTAGEGQSESSSFRDGDTASMSSFQTGSFIHTSQMGESINPNAPRKTKAQLWNDIKISSTTRAFTFIYSLSLLMLFTRIQLNLLGRLNYIASVKALAQPPPPGTSNSILLEDHDDATSSSFGNNYEVNRRYLTFSYHLLHKGYAQILDKVRTAVEEALGQVSPTEGLSADRLRKIVLNVRKHVEGATEQERYATRWLPYLLPPQEEEENLLVEANVITPPQTSSSSSPGAGLTMDPSPERTSYLDTSTGSLRQLLDETADLIDSPSFTRIHTLLLNTMFSHLIDQKVIASSYPQPNIQSPPASEASAPHPRIQELDSAVTVVPAEPRVKLANILAILTRQAHAIGNGNNPPNEYVAKCDAEVRELDSFAAVIYTSNLESQIESTKTQPGSEIKSSDGMGVSDAGIEHADEMIESHLESAWAKVTSSTTFSSR